MTRVSVHIDQLVLDGLQPVAAGELREVVARELGRYVAEQGVPAGLERPTSVARVDGGVLTTGSQQPLATGISRAIYRGMER
jgi:hypothetical protein